MAIYRVEAPDGSILRIEGPEFVEPGELEAVARQHYEMATQPGQPAPENPALLGKSSAQVKQRLPWELAQLVVPSA